jgi:VWFA-related protein
VSEIMMINRVTRPLTRLTPSLVFLLLMVTSAVTGQTTSQPADDVLRINTELVQTDVMVFDRRGHFVDGLKPEQFVLTLNGEGKQLSLFERIISGSSAETAQSSSNQFASPAAANSPNPVSHPGRLIFFFIDDVHLSGESIARTRKALLHFVDHALYPEDRLAIVSTSGEIGFLQQLSNNQAVLHEAIARLDYKQNNETYAGKTRISEYMASRIADGDRRLFAYLMESVKIEYGMGVGALRGDHGNDSAGQARRLLQSRLGQINTQARVATTSTLAVLQGLMNSTVGLPGRKLVFFLSDGFVVDPRNTTSLNSLEEATRIAAQSGAVIYSIDMRGSFLESTIDASNNDYVDMTARHGGVSLGETLAPRAPLNLLASETGGRTIINSSDLNRDLDQAVKETSNYYVLAWRPSSDAERSGKARLEVSIEGRPDLKVRLRRAYYVAPESTSGKTSTAKAPAATPEAELLRAMGSAQPLRALSPALSIGYVKSSPADQVLQVSLQLPRESVHFDSSAAQPKSEIDVIGAAIDDRGLIYTFKQVLTVTPQPANQIPVPVIWTEQLKVQPDLYQVRVAVRERTSGRTGSAMEWIEVPRTDLQLSMSTLFLGERKVQEGTLDQPQTVPVDVDHRFARSSALRFQTYVYNASRKAGAPDVWIDATVIRGNERIMVVATNRIPPDLSKDQWRLPYWSELALSQLAPGSYTLQVAATDRSSGTSTLQRITFSVE